MKKFIVFPQSGFALIKKYFFIALAVLCAVIIALLASKFNISQNAAVNRNYKGSAYEFKEKAADINLPQDEKRNMLIYVTPNERLAAAVMDKGILGYQMRSISGFLEKKPSNKSISFTYRSFFENYTVTWGFADNSVKEITVGTQKAQIIEYSNGLLWIACEKGKVKAGEIQFS